MSTRTIFIIILISNCFLSAFSQVLLKKGSLKGYEGFIRQYVNPYVISGYSCFMINLIINGLVLKVLPLTLVNPIAEALPIVLSFFSGCFIFGESITKRKIAGGLLILAGLSVILV